VYFQIIYITISFLLLFRIWSEFFFFPLMCTLNN